MVSGFPAFFSFIPFLFPTPLSLEGELLRTSCGQRHSLAASLPPTQPLRASPTLSRLLRPSIQPLGPPYWPPGAPDLAFQGLSTSTLPAGNQIGTSLEGCRPSSGTLGLLYLLTRLFLATLPFSQRPQDGGVPCIKPLITC